LPTGGVLYGYRVFDDTPAHVSSWTSSLGTVSGVNVQIVPFGSDWTLMSYSFVVPDNWFTVDQWGNTIKDSYGNPTSMQVGMITLWFDVRPNPSSTSASVWFADPELYVVHP
jgi:hypothetical protein